MNILINSKIFYPNELKREVFSLSVTSINESEIIEKIKERIDLTKWSVEKESHSIKETEGVFIYKCELSKK